MNKQSLLPKELCYYFPAEWEKHEATWLTWPYMDDSFPGKLELVISNYLKFIEYLTRGEKVRLIVPNEKEKVKVEVLTQSFKHKENIELFIHPSNDVWCRDHGPAFLVNPTNIHRKAIVNWEFNAWGCKYAFEYDNHIPLFIAEQLGLPVFYPGIVMEGGSVDFNGKGTLITTQACLLNPNRNPSLSQLQIEQYLQNYYGVDQVLWLNEGIAGDDTNGHVDDITRFVNENTVITAIETKPSDENYEPLQKNLKQLKKMRLLNGKQLDIIEIPMPSPIYYHNQRLPASYANFYIANVGVIVPTFRCKNDTIALKIIEQAFPDKRIYDIDSSDIICGLGSFHCLSQQEPLV